MINIRKIIFTLTQLSPFSKCIVQAKEHIFELPALVDIF